MEEQKYGRTFPGCMKGLVHFLDLHHHLHLSKMKVLTYKRHGDGKRAARNKEPKTDPDAPSTSQQYGFTEDTCFGLEDKVSTRKHPVKSSMKISFPKWGLREHNRKIKVSPPASRLLRTSSIHHWIDLHVDNMNFGVKTPVIEQNVDVNKASSSSERVYILSSSLDERDFDKQCADNMDYSKSSSSCPIQPDELENILQIKKLHVSNTLNEIEIGSFAPKDTNANELQEDVILHPSKEFLAMMKLFNGNIGLIQNILDDPSFIFSHYLQDKDASSAELTRAYSFPSPWHLERKNDGQFRIKHKRYEGESLVKLSGKFHSENLSTHTDKTEEDTPKKEVLDGDEERTPILVETNVGSEMMAPSSVSGVVQNVSNNPLNSNRFVTIKHDKKDYHRIFMDGILHKIPFGRKVMNAMWKSKFDLWDVCTMEKLDGEALVHSSWKKINKKAKKNIQRSQSLNDYFDKYSHLYESISKDESKGLPGRTKVKSFGRIFSLPDIKYCSSGKNTQSEVPFSSPKNLSTSHREKILEKEESKKLNTEVSSSKRMEIDCGEIPLQSSEKEQYESSQISEKLAKEALIREEKRSITQQGEKPLDTYELTEPTLISAAWSLAQGDVSLGFLDYAVSNSKGLEHRYPSEHSNLSHINADDVLQNNEIDLGKAKPSPDIDFFDSLHLQIDQKDKVKFNYVREVLKRSGFSDSDLFEALLSPYQPMDTLILNEAGGLSYELDNTEDEQYNILLEHQLLFDLINEALVEIYKKFFGYFFPWLSCFNTNTRPMPKGNHILEEIWANICWHMKCQPQAGRTLEDTVSQNFTKDDGWMNIQYDIEDVEIELECLILDDLLDDVALQLSLLSGSNPIPC